MDDNSNKAEPALGGVAQVGQLADELTALADVLHRRLLAAIAARAALPPPEQDSVITLAQAQTLFEAEVAVRQNANLLYANAAGHVLDGFGLPQARLVTLTRAAAHQIDQVQQVQDAATLVLDVLALATASVRGQPEPAIKALQKIAQQLDKLQQDHRTARLA